MLEISLITIVLLVLVLPVTIHFVEKNLEVFLFIMGLFAVSFAHFLGAEPMWSASLVKEALKEPIFITLAVLTAGVLVYIFKNYITNAVIVMERSLGRKWFCFLLITGLGLVSSVITAIIASIVLVEIINVIKYDKEFEIKLIVLGCFSIGFGAALTPIGEPLSTICIAKLKGDPYNAGFFFLFKNLGVYIIPGIAATGLLSLFFEPKNNKNDNIEGLHEKETDKISDVFIRAAKVYLFIMALIFLGTGFKPIIDKYIINLPSLALYWINIVSAIMDNATLTAAEISPKMALSQIQSVLLGLLIAGGILIPGNIPNIISAGRLGIRSKEWARIGIPVGLGMMVIYFAVFLIQILQ